MTELTMTQWLTNFEVIDCPLLWSPLLALSFLIRVVLFVWYRSWHSHVLHSSHIFSKSLLFEHLLMLACELMSRIGNRRLCWLSSWLNVLDCAVLSRIETLSSVSKLRHWLVVLIFGAHCIWLNRHFKHFVFANSLS